MNLEAMAEAMVEVISSRSVNWDGLVDVEPFEDTSNTHCPLLVLWG